MKQPGAEADELAEAEAEVKPEGEDEGGASDGRKYERH